ncbi:hypothetical protein NIES2098_18070 [Calothrix sp. NIES-2098]|nr:hypothetical protein NIES2098_18070 [Calothrix sp. NIES-2098]
MQYEYQIPEQITEYSLLLYRAPHPLLIPTTSSTINTQTNVELAEY